MGSLEDIVDTSTAYAAGGYRKVSPMFVPRILINMAAGHLTMKYGFQVSHLTCSEPRIDVFHLGS